MDPHATWFDFIPGYGALRDGLRRKLVTADGLGRVLGVLPSRRLTAALETKWWVLAKGDRRDFVAIDMDGGTHNVARRVEGGM